MQLKTLVVKTVLATSAFCLAVTGTLLFMSGTWETTEPAAASPIKSAPSASPDVASEPVQNAAPALAVPLGEDTKAAPLPDKTFTKQDEDATPPAIEKAPSSLAPSTLYIPSVGIDTSIVSGAANNGSMVLPESSKVAEYTGAAPLAAANGSTVIAGHVNFADGSWGAMGTLHGIYKGAMVYASDASGEMRTFKVTEMRVLKKQALPYEIFRTAGARQLVLITCGGNVETVNGTSFFASNLLVFAEPV